MVYQGFSPHYSLRKIPLRLWSYRDYLEAVVENFRKESGEEELSQAGAKNIIKKTNQIDLIWRHFPHLMDQIDTDPLFNSSVEENPQRFFNYLTYLPEERVHQGALMLTDLNLTGISFFTRTPMLIGQTMMIELGIPSLLTLTVEISSTRIFNMHSRIIGNRRPPYRNSAKFIFLRKGEKTMLRNFIISLEEGELEEKTA